MFAWIKSFVGGTALPSLRSFHEALSDPNAFLDVVSGRPEPFVGSLELTSGVVVLMDPCSDKVLELSGLVERRVTVRAEVYRDPVEELHNPLRSDVLGRLELLFDPNAAIDESRKLGTFEVDSGRIAVADRDDWKRHRQEVGPLRELRMQASFDPDWRIRFAIAKELGLDWRETDRYRMTYVATRPVEYQEYEAMLRVGWMAAGNEPPVDGIYPNFGLTHVTGSTFDRMNEFRGLGFLPIGEPHGPKAFVGLSGQGDGTYEVIGSFAGDRLVRVEVGFLADTD